MEKNGEDGVESDEAKMVLFEVLISFDMSARVPTSKSRVFAYTPLPRFSTMVSLERMKRGP